VGGPSRQLTLHLDIQADNALWAYCLRHNVSTGKAIRDIFTKAGEGPITPMAASEAYITEDGRRVVRPIRIKWKKIPPVPVTTYLPDLRPANSRARMSRTGYAKYRPTVLIARTIRVRLDGYALAGLLEAAQVLGKSHQGAARLLIGRST
jgi:hypothetical protein